MIQIIRITFLGVLRDRIFYGIFSACLLFLAIPVLSEFTMRQVTELSITLSLSLISFLLLLLSIFLGGTNLWRDIERRYTYSVLGMPLSKSRYLLGKFIGIALFVLLVALLLGLLAIGVIWLVSQQYPPSRSVLWPEVVMAVWLDALKYILLVAIAFALSSVSTSFFLPIFGTIAIYLVGGVSQQAYDYTLGSGGEKLPQLVKTAVSIFYWVVPNFEAFNVKVNAIYGLGLTWDGCLKVMLYWLTYTTIVLVMAMWSFGRREML